MFASAADLVFRSYGGSVHVIAGRTSGEARVPSAVTGGTSFKRIRGNAANFPSVVINVHEAVQTTARQHALVPGEYEVFAVKSIKFQIVIANNLRDGMVTEQNKNVKYFLMLRGFLSFCAGKDKSIWKTERGMLNRRFCPIKRFKIYPLRKVESFRIFTAEE